MCVYLSTASSANTAQSVLDNKLDENSTSKMSKPIQLECVEIPEGVFLIGTKTPKIAADSKSPLI